MESCPFCAILTSRIWIESEHAFAFAADAPAAEGHIIVVPKEHVASIHALPMAVQKDVFGIIAEVRGRLRTGLVPDSGFSIGFDESAAHSVIHVVPRRAGDRVELPKGVDWVTDDGVLA